MKITGQVGLKDVNPKDHIFIPPTWRALDVYFVPSLSGDYMSEKCPSDHLGVGAVLPGAPATHAVLTQLKAGKAVYEADKLPKTLKK